MENKISFPEQFISSICKLKSYNYFFQQSLGRAFLYLFLASVILAGLGGIRFMVEFNTAIDEVIDTMKSDLPYFELRDGELTVDAEMPYIVSESADHIFIIDTTGQSDQSALNGYDIGMLFTKDDMYQKQSRFETRHYDLGAFAGLTVTRSDVMLFMPMLKWMIAFIAFFGFIFYFCGKLLGALIVSIGGLIIESTASKKIGFGNLYKLSLYALTLPMFIKMVLTLMQVTVPLFFIIYYSIALFYLYKAVMTVRDNSEEDAAGPYPG